MKKKWRKWRARKGRWQVFLWNAEKHKKIYLDYAGAYNLCRKWAELLVKASIEPGAMVYLGMEKMPERQ